MNQGELVERNGKLFVLDEWESDFMRPIQYRTAWPTGLSAQNFAHLVGRRVMSRSNGICVLDNGIKVSLEDGGATKPNAGLCEERAIKKPKNARQFINGAWH